jgi:hypothetical protein
MTQSAAMPGPTTRVNADRRRDKEIADARSPASDPALLGSKYWRWNGMSFGVSGGSDREQRP